MWNDFIAYNAITPWMIIGDFNSVTDQSEKSGGTPITLNDVSPFNDMISHTDMIDIGYSGNKFTWTNNRIGRA